jgi:hypothetical protein
MNFVEYGSHGNDKPKKCGTNKYVQEPPLKWVGIKPTRAAQTLSTIRRIFSYPANTTP